MQRRIRSAHYPSLLSCRPSRALAGHFLTCRAIGNKAAKKALRLGSYREDFLHMKKALLLMGWSVELSLVNMPERIELKGSLCHISHSESLEAAMAKTHRTKEDQYGPEPPAGLSTK